MLERVVYAFDRLATGCCCVAVVAPTGIGVRNRKFHWAFRINNVSIISSDLRMNIRREKALLNLQELRSCATVVHTVLYCTVLLQLLFYTFERGCFQSNAWQFLVVHRRFQSNRVAISGHA